MGLSEIYDKKIVYNKSRIILLMELIGKYKNSGFEVVADGVISFFDRREDLHTNGIAFGQRTSLNADLDKVSTNISLV